MSPLPALPAVLGAVRVAAVAKPAISMGLAKVASVVRVAGPSIARAAARARVSSRIMQMHRVVRALNRRRVGSRVVQVVGRRATDRMFQSVSRSPRLAHVILPHRPRLEREMLRALDRAAYRFNPRVFRGAPAVSQNLPHPSAPPAARSDPRRESRGAFGDAVFVHSTTGRTVARAAADSIRDSPASSPAAPVAAASQAKASRFSPGGRAIQQKYGDLLQTPLVAGGGPVAQASVERPDTAQRAYQKMLERERAAPDRASFRSSDTRRR